MATNDFLLYATDSGANVETQSEYSADADRPAGAQTGVADARLANKAWRQSSIMTAVLASLINDYTGDNAIDDGTTTALANSILKLFRLQGGTYAQDIGSANAIAIGLTGITNYTLLIGVPVKIKVVATNTGNMTINVNGLGTKLLLASSGQQIPPGIIAIGSIITVIYNSTSFFLQGNAADTRPYALLNGDYSQEFHASQFLAANGLFGSVAGTKFQSRGTDTASVNNAVTNVVPHAVGDPTGAAHAVPLHLFDASLISTGYQPFPGGLTLQWGRYTTATGNGDVFNFPLTFPTACFQAVCADSGNGIRNTAIVPLNNSQAQVWAGWTSGSCVPTYASGVGVNWFALGH